MTGKSVGVVAQPGSVVLIAPAPTKKSPTLSVIVPVYNSVGFFKRSLEALSLSTYDDYEVLVVDDGSTEAIEPLVSPYGYRYMKINGPSGPGVARNRGVEAVKGRYVVFVDADVCVHPDTLGRMAEVFTRDPGLASLIGTYDDQPDDPGFISQYKNLFHHYVHQDSDGPVTTFWAGCGAMRRDVFTKFGGFDEKRYRRPSIEDIDLGTRISMAGERIVLDQKVQCKHLKKWTFGNLLKTDVLDRGVPWIQLMLRVGSMNSTLNTKWSQRLCVAAVYLAVLCVAAAVWYPVLWWLVLGLAGFVTAVNLDFYRYFATRRGLWFTLRTVPLHWLYFIYCGYCILAGMSLHYLGRD